MPDMSLIEIIRQKVGDQVQEFLLPPPVFESMHGEFIAFDPQAGILRTRFPVLHEFLNPYKTMQGGMLAAAVDNTIGPLSMLVAPPNVTRRLEMKYSKPVTTDLPYITVEGKFLGQEGQRLTFSAAVRDPQGALLARARASHWIIDPES
jgi:acyl-coenzyme A thioesterase PaaI-like protein